MNISGTWENEFGSTLAIDCPNDDGIFSGVYRSSTGATGVYPVVGIIDPAPVGNSAAVSFTVSWRSQQGPADPSWHWVSGFTGLLRSQDGRDTIATTYLLQQNPVDNTPEWMATAVYTSTFTRKD